jgi:glucose/arabinose dehydrogenase
MRRVIWAGGVLMATLAGPAVAEVVARGQSSAGEAFVVEELARAQGVPWAFEFVDQNALLFTERSGRIKRLSLPDARITDIKGVPDVMARGQGGLLDIARPPAGEGRDWYYVTWVKNVDGQGVTVLSRARLEGDAMTQWQDLLVTRSGSDTGRHFGSRIAFDGKGYLYFGVGDRGHRPNGQDLTTHAGSIIRLTVDGEVPDDNPFVDQPGALNEIWSYGHRNPQGLAYDATHDRLWENEHGPRGGDEINLIQRGGNYGWAVLSYGKEYWGPFDVGEGTERPGMVAPIKVYIPSIAPGSLLYYRGDAFPGWRGSLFSGALAMTHLNRVTLDAGGAAIAEERLLGELNERIRALEEGPDGALYLGTDSGRILRLRPPAGE